MDKENIEHYILGCKNDDRNCQEYIFKTYYGQLMVICLRYSKNKEKAEDYLQDAFLKIFKNIKKYEYKKESAFLGWIKQVAVNNILDSLRREKKLFFTENNIFLESKNQLDGEEEYLFQDNFDIKKEDIIKEIQKLPPSQRVIFNLYVLEGLTHKEISEKLNIAEGTSKSNLHKSKEKLKIQMKKYLNVECL